MSGKNSVNLNSLFVNIFLHMKVRDSIETALERIQNETKGLLKVVSKLADAGTYVFQNFTAKFSIYITYFSKLIICQNLIIKEGSYTRGGRLFI